MKNSNLINMHFHKAYEVYMEMILPKTSVKRNLEELHKNYLTYIPFFYENK